MTKGAVMWITGLPASGKSTFAQAVHEALLQRGVAAVVLDSDDVRAALVPPHGYTAEGRAQFYETLARMAALLANQGLIVLVAATANRRAFRDRARALAPRFFEVWVQASPEECARRDPKGLYRRAAAGDAPTLPGAGAEYEPPPAADLTADGGHDAQAVRRAVALLT